MKARLHLAVCDLSHRLHLLGHRAEHGLHLAYFAGLSTADSQADAEAQAPRLLSVRRSVGA